MYQGYWNLSRTPFEGHLDVDFYYPAGSHAAALLKLKYLVDADKGAGVLAAGPGLGKSLVTQVLESQLDPSTHPVVRLLYPRLDAAGVLAQIAIRLGVTPAEVESVSVGLDQIVERLRNRLAATCKAGHRPVIVVEDAHLIESPEVWHALRLLLNFREEQGVRFTLLLVGQPTLLGMLRSFGDLYDRLAVRVSLAPLTAEDVAQYVRHRLTVAGTEANVFSPAALANLSDLSVGVPRMINQLADLTLLVGYADKLEQITEAEMVAANEEMQIASIS